MGEDYEKMLINRLNERLDIIYIDPPYKTDFIMRAIGILKREIVEIVNYNNYRNR